MGWQKYPLFRLLVPFITGMLIADFAASVLTTHITVLYICLCSCAAVLFMQNGRRSRDSFYFKFGVSAMVFFLILGATLYTLEYKSVRTEGLSVASCGIIVKPVEKKARSWAVKMETPEGSRFIAYIDKRSDSTLVTEMCCGDTILFHSRHISPTCPLDLTPADSTFAPYRSHLFHSGVGATCYIRQGDWHVRKSDDNSGMFRQWRTFMSDAYTDAGLTDEEGALIEALTTGERSNLSEQLVQDYSRSGASHILSLSGFHLAVIFSILNLVLSGIYLPYRWQWAKSFAIITCLWTFTMIAEAPPSLVRSAVMCSLMSLSGCFGRPVISVNSLTLAAFAMLSFSPMMLRDIAFQLSYLSVLAICTVAVPCCRKIEDRLRSIALFLDTNWFKVSLRQSLTYFAGVAVVSLVCSVATTPLVAYYFHTVPLFSVVTNLLVSVLSVILLYASALWWIFFWCEGVRDIFTFILERSAWCMNTVAKWISSLDWSVFVWSPNILQVSLSYIFFVSAVAFFHHRTATALKLTLIALIALLMSLILRGVSFPDLC